MSSLSARGEALRRSFWFLPTVAIVLGLGAGFALPELDRALNLELDTLAFSFNDAGSARSILETIATVTVSVAGISFSVTVVALTLASQQLSPRVLRTFQANRLSQTTLAVFVGAFVYCLVLLSSLGPGEVPELSVTLAIFTAVAAFGLFVVFIHDIVTSLLASTIIRRIAADGQHAVAFRYPSGIGEDPRDQGAAEDRARELMAESESIEVRADRAGFLVSIAGSDLLAAARKSGAVVAQRAPIGDFVVTGGLLAEAWCDESEHEGLAEALRRCFRQGDERTIVQDVAFPVRQLADVALRGLSPSLNDPTTAENAMNSLADTLIRFVREGHPPSVRVDSEGSPRFVAASVELGDLVRLGFDQVRVKAASYPVVSVRLLVLLREVEREARAAGADCSEIERQALLLAEGSAGEVPTEADAELVRSARAGGDG